MGMDEQDPAGAGAPPTPPRLPARVLTMAEERQRRQRKATVGEVEDAMRNLMRLVKQQFAARDKILLELVAQEQTLDPGWAPPPGPPPNEPGAPPEGADATPDPALTAASAAPTSAFSEAAVAASGHEDGYVDRGEGEE